MRLTSAPPCPRLLLASGCSFPSSLPAGSELSTRLKELEEAGLITREDAPPPIATVLYTLSETGMALEPVLKSLGLWGLRLMAEERPDDAFQARWLAYAPEWFTTDADPGAPPVVIQLVATDESAVVELGDGRVRTMPQAKRRVAGGVLGGDLAQPALSSALTVAGDMATSIEYRVPTALTRPRGSSAATRLRSAMGHSVLVRAATADRLRFRSPPT